MPATDTHVIIRCPIPRGPRRSVRDRGLFIDRRSHALIGKRLAALFVTCVTAVLACVVDTRGATAAGAESAVPAVFEPYLADGLPRIVEERKEKQVGSIRVREFWFESRRLASSGAAYEIHCVLARPAGDGRRPGSFLVRSAAFGARGPTR